MAEYNLNKGSTEESMEHANDDFYIGYLQRAPRKYARMTIISIGLIVAVLLVAGIANGFFQNKFNPGYFEFDELTEINGVLYKSPVPRLVIDEKGAMPRSVILVGAGKMGALGTIEAMENKLGDLIDGRAVVLRGTLIYGEGKALMELTAHEYSLISASDNWEGPRNPEFIKEIKLRGEIVDPKCYFGVMKPGKGKTHRACAIRCVSGGIPPVLRVDQPEGPPKFYLLRGQNGERMNKQLLDFIADDVFVEGRHSIIDDWDILDVGLIILEGSDERNPIRRVTSVH
jgi:hypothetical protein